MAVPVGLLGHLPGCPVAARARRTAGEAVTLPPVRHVAQTVRILIQLLPGLTGEEQCQCPAVTAPTPQRRVIHRPRLEQARRPEPELQPAAPLSAFAYLAEGAEPL